MNPAMHSYERYHRQIILKEFGEEGQRKLAQASVLVVGAGGLGCPALQYLTAAGLGSITVADDDLVSLHNLHRQVLYTTADIGLPKADVAAKRLNAMNPDVQVTSHSVRITAQNAIGFIEGRDVVLDATDNFATRYLINDACVLLNKPLVYGAISQFEGQVAVFNAGKDSVNYRSLFPHPPPPGSVLNCAEAGVLGVLPGIIGTVQAAEVIKLLAQIGKPLVNRLFTFNALTAESFVFEIAAKEGTTSLIPKTIAEFEQLDYEWLCEGSVSKVEEIEALLFNSLFKRKDTVVIDVREEGEQPQIKSFPNRKIPLSLLKETVPEIAENTVILFCQSGKRSRDAAKILSDAFRHTKKIYSLKGGILNWNSNGKEG